MVWVQMYEMNSFNEFGSIERGLKPETGLISFILDIIRIAII
jgi:hypothetical protein